MTRQVWIRKTNASEPLATRREPVPDIETDGGWYRRDVAPFQPHWKAFFNYKLLFLAHKIDALGLSTRLEPEPRRALNTLNAAVVSQLLPTLGCAPGRSMWTVSWCRPGCRSNGPRGATTRTSGRCPATTRSWRTWRRRTSCGSRTGRATSTMGRRACRSCAPCGPSRQACARAEPGCGSARAREGAARSVGPAPTPASDRAGVSGGAHVR